MSSYRSTLYSGRISESVQGEQNDGSIITSEKFIKAIFSRKHYGYFSDLIKGVDNTSLIDTNYKKNRTNASPAVKINSWGFDIDNPIDPQSTSCLNVDQFGRIFGPYVESPELLESLSQERIEDLMGIRHLTIVL